VSRLHYPGRDRVITRDAARDVLWRQSLETGSAYPCEAPFVIHAIGLPSFLDPDRSKLPVEIPARCRKCSNCLLHRRRLWTARAMDEVQASTRSWFGTLTVNPMNRFSLGIAAERKRLRRGGETLSSLDPSEQFTILADELQAEATKWLKRVRAQSGASLRYLLVSEAHKSGFPHLHILLHEQTAPIPKLMLERQWVLGFSHWRLIGQEAKASSYACKYLSKEARTRVRASLRYGQANTVRLKTEAAVKLADTLRGLRETRSATIGRCNGDMASHEGMK